MKRALLSSLVGEFCHQDPGYRLSRGERVLSSAQNSWTSSPVEVSKVRGVSSVQPITGVAINPGHYRILDLNPWGGCFYLASRCSMRRR